MLTHVHLIELLENYIAVKRMIHCRVKLQSRFLYWIHLSNPLKVREIFNCRVDLLFLLLIKSKKKSKGRELTVQPNLQGLVWLRRRQGGGGPVPAPSPRHPNVVVGGQRVVVVGGIS